MTVRAAGDEEVFGSGGRLGYISPSTCERAAKEFYLAAPENVAMLIASLPISRVIQDHVDQALTRIEDAARQLADTGADAVFAAGFPLTLQGGPDFDAELRNKLEVASGLPVMSELSATVEAFNALACRTIGVVAPFREALTVRLAEVLASFGIEVVAHRSFDEERQSVIEQIPHSRTREAIRELLAERPDVDALYLPVGRINSLVLLEDWELEFSRPTVTANQIMIWRGLQQLGVKAQHPYGRLLGVS